MYAAAAILTVKQSLLTGHAAASAPASRRQAEPKQARSHWHMAQKSRTGLIRVITKSLNGSGKPVLHWVSEYGTVRVPGGRHTPVPARSWKTACGAPAQARHGRGGRWGRLWLGKKRRVRCGFNKCSREINARNAGCAARRRGARAWPVSSRRVRVRPPAA